MTEAARGRSASTTDLLPGDGNRSSTKQAGGAISSQTEIRPFRVDMPDETIDERQVKAGGSRQWSPWPTRVTRGPPGGPPAEPPGGCKGAMNWRTPDAGHMNNSAPGPADAPWTLVRHAARLRRFFAAATHKDPTT